MYTPNRHALIASSGSGALRRSRGPKSSTYLSYDGADLIGTFLGDDFTYWADMRVDFYVRVYEVLTGWAPFQSTQSNKEKGRRCNHCVIRRKCLRCDSSMSGFDKACRVLDISPV